MTREPVLAYSIFTNTSKPQGLEISEPWAGFVSRLLAHEAVGYVRDPGPRGRQEERHVDLYSPATFVGAYRSRANVRTRAFVVLDIEAHKATGEVPPPPQFVLDGLTGLGWLGVVATSWKHTESNPRYRVVVPLAEPVLLHASAEVEADAALAWGLAKALGLDGVLDGTKACAESQFFWPIHAPGAPWFAAACEGMPLGANALAMLRVEGAAVGADKDVYGSAYNAADLAHARQDRADMQPSRRYGPSVIDAFNAAHPLEELLTKHGYWRRRGVHWRSPHQTSDSFATRVYPNGRWVSLSGSDIAAGIGRRAAGGAACSGDAFDLYVHFDQGGDHAAALKAAARELGFDRPKPTHLGDVTHHRVVVAVGRAAALSAMRRLGVGGGLIVANAGALVRVFVPPSARTVSIIVSNDEEHTAARALARRLSRARVAVEIHSPTNRPTAASSSPKSEA